MAVSGMPASDGVSFVDGDGASPADLDLPPAIAGLARLVAQAACPMVLLVGRSGRLVPNEASAIFFGGQETGSLIGRSMLGAAPAHGDLFALALERAYLGMASRFSEQPVRRGASETRWFNLEFTPVTDETGTVLGALCMACDVTDMVSRSRERERSPSLGDGRVQFEVLTEALPQIVWSSDADGRHDYFSRRWSEFTGIAPEDITEDLWKQLVYPRHRTKVRKAWDEARQSGKPYDIDYRFRHRSGEYRWLRVMALPVCDESGRIVRWCGTSTDVHETYLVAGERHRLALELKRTATVDQLTKALTRRAFLERAAKVLRRHGKLRRPTSVLMMDIDHFKRINDTCGHAGGDEVLSAVAQRLSNALKKGDVIGRLGGEEFAVVLQGSDSAMAMDVAERLRRSVEAEPVVLADRTEITVTVSLGATTSATSKDDLHHLLVAADKALYRAKAAGRNRAVLISALECAA
jgi:diguanylate cyclase (GGDEF)-like protein/PAS domain S-box-containing protein